MERNLARKLLRGNLVWKSTSKGIDLLKRGLRYKYIGRSIEVVITASTRNRVYQKWYRGFESHLLRHERGFSFEKPLFYSMLTIFDSVSKEETFELASKCE